METTDSLIIIDGEIIDLSKVYKIGPVQDNRFFHAHSSFIVFFNLFHLNGHVTAVGFEGVFVHELIDELKSIQTTVVQRWKQVDKSQIFTIDLVNIGDQTRSKSRKL